MSSSSAAAAGALGITMVAITCGATGIAALLLSQHEKTEDRLAEALRLLAQKEEQLQQACHERSRLNDQLTAERIERMADRSANSTSSRTALAGGHNPNAPKPLDMDPHILGLMPNRRASSRSAQPPSAAGHSRGSKPVVADTSGITELESASHVATPLCAAPPKSAATELAELRQADLEGAIQFLHRHNLSEHEDVFRQQNVQGSDICDVLEPDKHGFSAEQKLGWLGIKGDAKVVAFAAVLEQLSAKAAEGD